MPSTDFRDHLLEQLQDLEFCATYLTTCYEDSETVFLIALRNVIDAHGGIGKLARNTELNRESLYRMLSEKGNPKLSSLGLILDSIGLQLNFIPKSEDSKEAA